MMLLQRSSKFLEVFNETLRDASKNYEKETSAATLIQRVIRGGRSRTSLLKKNYAANEIQRVFRGFLGRVKSSNSLHNKSNNRQLSLFHYLSIQIQKSFRGYYSRKYKHCQAARKKYCRTLLEEGEKIRNMMKQYSLDQEERENYEAQTKKEQEFKTLAQNLHHLISTNHISGIYNPSYQFLETPTMNSMPVESHIRGVVKDLLRTRGIAKTGLVTDIHGTKKIPISNQKYRISIQASSAYDTLKVEERKQKSLHKIITANKGPFTAGGRTSVIDKSLPPLNVGIPFMDSWANPLLVKGVPTDTQQLLECGRTQKPLFVTHIEKPFVSRVGGNKSSALPNDVFDTIAEAQETGGAAQRQLGTGTARFGLPQSCDRRADGLLAAPPFRTSATVKSTNTRTKKYIINNVMSKSAGQQPNKIPREPPAVSFFNDNEFTAYDDQSSSPSLDSPITMDQRLQRVARADSDSDDDL